MEPVSPAFDLPAHQAQHSFFWDSMHVPRPLPPLAGEAWQVLIQSFSGRGTAVVNGYGYMGLAPTGETIRIEEPPMSDPVAIWYEFSLPRTMAICKRLRETDYLAMDAAELAARLPELMSTSAIAWSYTMQPMNALMGPMSALMAFLAPRLGAEADLVTMTLLQGHANESSAAGERMAGLVRLAASLPAVAAALRRHEFAAAALVEGGQEFAEAFDAYLEEYGHGNQTWAELHRPGWAEDPTVPLTMIATLLDQAGRDAQASHARSALLRAELLAETEAKLTGPADRAELNRLLAAARDYVPIIEDRARWQLASNGALRPAILELGRKLAADSRIATTDDIFFFHANELGHLARGTFEGQADALAAERRAAFESWKLLTPPPALGAPLPSGFQDIPMLAKMFGFGAPQSEGNVVRGNPASRGVVRGRARIILDLEDAGALIEGEILVCQFTSPPWTPLFAIAAAVVTNAGGVLSHAAIEAREYAIPCVVGCGDATTRIPHGALVEVDGAAGTVTILE